MEEDGKNEGDLDLGAAGRGAGGKMVGSDHESK